jgi:hypothetical protein
MKTEWARREAMDWRATVLAVDRAASNHPSSHAAQRAERQVVGEIMLRKLLRQ